MDQRFGKLKKEWQENNTVKKKIKCSKGKLLQDSKEIIKEYQEYYK